MTSSPTTSTRSPATGASTCASLRRRRGRAWAIARTSGTVRANLARRDGCRLGSPVPTRARKRIGDVGFKCAGSLLSGCVSLQYAALLPGGTPGSPGSAALCLRARGWILWVRPRCGAGGSAKAASNRSWVDQGSFERAKRFPASAMGRGSSTTLVAAPEHIDQHGLSEKRSCEWGAWPTGSRAAFGGARCTGVAERMSASGVTG